MVLGGPAAPEALEVPQVQEFPSHQFRLINTKGRQYSVFRDQKAVDKILGQNFGVDVSSRELCQEAIVMMSSYRQNCLWPGLFNE